MRYPNSAYDRTPVRGLFHANCMVCGEPMLTQERSSSVRVACDECMGEPHSVRDRMSTMSPAQVEKFPD